MKPILFVLALLLSSVSLKAQDLTRFFDSADAFFATYVSDGRIDYNTLVAQPEPLNTLMEQLATIKVIPANETTYKAFWINAYNLAVIQGIVSAYPLASPLDKEGFFDQTLYVIGGMKLTLNDMENKKLRDRFHDARIHFVLVCGAKGCPPLIAEAYRPKKLETQLRRQATKALNNDAFIKVTTSEIYVSEIFKWYRNDFIKEAPSIISYINQFRKKPINTTLTLKHYPYDWSLNEK
tara:strand:+ start:46293 stop:47003 length:711 start_codon:yes stop_codon:yes gene_type:complete